MKKKRSYHAEGWLRKFRTTQERRMWYAHKDDVHIRGRRSANKIPDPWDDYQTCIQKSWKVKRKTQYRGRSDKTEHIVQLPCYIREWDIKEDFDAADIPYRLDEIKTSYTKLVYQWGKILTFRPAPWGTCIHKGQKGYWYNKWFEDHNKPKVERHYCSTDYYILTYWHDKKLDLDYLCSLT